MAILPVVKVTQYGTADQKDAVLDGLQELGIMHLVDLNRSHDEDTHQLKLFPNAFHALKFLRTSPTHRRATKDDSSFQFDKVVEKALWIEEQQQQFQAEHDELKIAIEQLTPWGNFQLPADGDLSGLRLWFYIIPHYRVSLLEQIAITWHVVARDHRFVYIVVLSSDEPIGMPVSRVHLNDRPLSELRRRFEDVKTELEELHWQRVKLTRWTHLLSRTIGIAKDRAARQRAAEQALDDPTMFAIQGWIPSSQSDQIRSFAQQHELGLTIESPSTEELPPTLLANRGLTAGGEDAMSFYTTPAYRTWDPSSVVFWSFSVFFAMIMSDAGYAVLLVILSLLFWGRLGESSSGVRLRKLFVAIAITSVAYGIAVGSYFGFPPPKGSVLDRLHVVDAANMTLMMQISISIGVAHLTLANLALSWSRRWSPMMLSSIGWASILAGGLAFGLGKSGIGQTDTLIYYGTWTIGAGIVGIFFFSSDRPIFTLSLKDHGKRFVDGILSLTSISRIFGDVLSYLRLFALGLASAQLAATFNELTYKASCCFGVGSLLAVVAVVFGHGLNFALVIMSGVVHGLRLNCIEFFGWSLPDEGYPFQPFCKKAK